MLRSFVTQPALSPTRPTIDPTTNFVLALCSPFLPSSRALSLSISFFLSPSLSLSIFVLLFAEHSLSSLPCSLQSLLFQPHLSISSFLFWQPPLFLLPVLSLPAYSPVSPTRRQSWALLEETPVPAIIEIKSSILVDAAFTHSMFYMFFRLFYTIHPLDLIFFYSIFIFIFFYQRYENKLNFISKFFWIYIYLKLSSYWILLVFCQCVIIYLYIFTFIINIYLYILKCLKEKQYENFFNKKNVREYFKIIYII